MVPAIKYDLVKQAEGKVVEIENFYRQGFITDDELMEVTPKRIRLRQRVLIKSGWSGGD